MTIHEEIDELLAADLHNQLSESERQTLHAHLVECADCRQLHNENRAMNAILTDSFEAEKPDMKFEHRMLGAFRNRVPDRGLGLLRFLVTTMRSRAARLTAIAAVLLALIQTGRFLTTPAYNTGEELAVQAVPAEGSFEEMRLKAAGFDSVAVRTDQQRRVERSRSTVSKYNGGVTAEAAPATANIQPQFQEQGLPAATASDAEAKLKGRYAAGGTQSERTIITGSKIPTAEEDAPKVQTLDDVREPQLAAMQAPSSGAAPVPDNRKLIRNASVELEVNTFDEAVQKITALATEGRGYIATTSSEKQANGKLKGEIVAKVLPENLDGFLAKLRGLGELKNQTLGTEDVTKQYFDTDSRLKNQRAMEQRLLEILKKKSDDINDLLAVEKELGRVREEIEKMQGELKFMDAQVQFATVTIQLAEKDLDAAAKYLLKEKAQLALFAPEVEQVYNEIKALASPKVQITNAQLDRDNIGRVSARVSMLIAPEASDGVIAKTTSLGRVENFQVTTQRVAQGGSDMSEEAATRRDKVELNITISRDEQEQARQQTTLSIRTGDVNDRTKQLRDLADKQGGRIRSSSFSRDPNGREFANVSLRVPMKNYTALMQSLGALGKLENISVRRDDRPDAAIDEANAPADVTIQVYSQGNIVTEESGLIATIRRTLGQGVAALMWSVRMIGVALAFFVPWILALALVVWIVRRVRRSRAANR